MSDVVRVGDMDLKAELMRIAKSAAGTELPERYYRCPDCMDTGFVTHRDAGGRWWGRRCAPCFANERLAHMTKKQQADPFYGAKETKKTHGDDIPF